MLPARSILSHLATYLFLSVIVAAFSGCSREKPATLSLIYNAEEQPAEKSVVAQILQADLKAKGIDIRLEPVPSTVYNDRIGKGEFDAALTLWYLDYPDPEGYLTDFYSRAGYRLSRYLDPEYDRLYLGGLFAPTEDAKVKSYRQTVAKLKADLPWVPLFSNSEVFLMKPQAAGFVSNPYQYYDYRKVGLKTIRAATDVEVQTLDPAQAYDLASKHAVTQSYEGLVALDGEARIVPALAASWNFSANNDRLTFNLRRDVQFNPAPFFANDDKRLVTSADVKASFERMIKSNSPYTYIFDYVEGVEAFKAGKADNVVGFRATEPATFEIVLTKPFPTMLSWLLAPATYVLPKELPAGYDFSKGSVGTGPFILRSWDGVTAAFERNPHYWLSGQPLADVLSIRVIKDTNTLTAAYKARELDILNVPISFLPEVFATDGSPKPGWEDQIVREVKVNNLKFVAFNMNRSPWGSDRALRQKFSDAIQRTALVNHVLLGKGRIATSVVPSGIPGFE